MVKPSGRLLIVWVIGILSAILVAVVLSRPSVRDVSILPLKSQTQIKNRVKIDVKPLISSPLDPLKFEIHLESMQDPALSQMYLTDTVMVTVDQNHTMMPVRWDKISQDPYHQHGIMIFEPIGTAVSTLQLTIFGYDPHAFVWYLD
jgi:hypothetical protein